MAQPHGKVYIPRERGELQTIGIVVDSRKANTQDTNFLVGTFLQDIRIVKAYFQGDQAINLSGTASYMILEKDDGTTETELANNEIGNYSADVIVDMPLKADGYVPAGTWLQVRYDQNTDQSGGTALHWNVFVEFYYVYEMR